MIGRTVFVTAVGVGALAIAMSDAAWAADMPVKAPPRAAAATVANWTGLYAGIYGGYGWGSADYDFPGDIAVGGLGGFSGIFSPFNAVGFAGGGSFGQRVSGGVFGGHVGYNQQLGSWVFGLEASAAWSGLDAQSRNVFPPALLFNGTAERTYATRLEWIATLTPRLGLAIGDWLLYAKAGLAAGQVVSELTSAQVANSLFVFHERRGHVGWTVGAGVEHAWTPNWIIGIEYNYADLGTEQYGGFAIRNGIPSARGQYDLSLSYHTLLARLSYKAAARATVAAAGSWSGFYAGVHGGYGWGDADYESRLDGSQDYFPQSSAGGGAFSQRLKGGIAGGHLGANYQDGHWLLGIEGAFARSGLKGFSRDVFTSGSLAVTTETYNTKLEWLATATPRLGYVGGPWLVYGKGGLAVGRVESRMTSTISGDNTFQEKTDHVGWTVGAGIEHAWSASWVFGLEYNYVDLGKQQYGGHQLVGGLPQAGPGYTVDLTFSTVTARLSYKFVGAP